VNPKFFFPSSATLDGLGYLQATAAQIVASVGRASVAQTVFKGQK